MHLVHVPVDWGHSSESGESFTHMWAMGHRHNSQESGLAQRTPGGGAMGGALHGVLRSIVDIKSGSRRGRSGRGSRVGDRHARVNQFFTRRKEVRSAGAHTQLDAEARCHVLRLWQRDERVVVRMQHDNVAACILFDA